MDKTVKERLVGMGVLLVLGVIFIPLILDGSTSVLEPNPSQNLNLPVPIEGVTHEMSFSDGNVRRITLPHPESISDESSEPKNSLSKETTQNSVATSGFINELPNKTNINPDLKNNSTTKQEQASISTQPNGTIDRSKNLNTTSSESGLQSTSTLQTGSKLSSTSAWVVQIGSFGDRKNAEKEVASLKAKGFPAFVRRFVTAEDNVLYRVRIGPEKNRARAEKLSERLTKAGIKGQIVADP